jgi:SPP1 gp7 family putative phage head morphogenesis protein
MYANYNNAFYSAITKGMPVLNASFSDLTDTKFTEQYLVNAFQFSAAKSRAEMKMLQKLVFDDKGQKRTFTEFQKLATPTLETFNKTWLRVEYDLASRGAVMAEKWQSMYKDRDIYPYGIYQTRHDGKVRPEHAALNGKVFRIDDAKAQGYYPPLDWSCRCTWEPTNEGDPVTDKEMDKYKDAIGDGFGGNVGINGIMPSEKHSYFDILPNANNANYNMFSSRPTNYIELNTNYYTPYQIQLAVNDWHEKQPSKDHTEVLFRNHEWKLNVRMSQETVNKIGRKSRGFENIKSTIEHPSEIWGRWQDVKEQKIVIMNYVSFNQNNAYIVETIGGKVTDAYFRQHTDSKNLRRIGILMIK